MKNTNFQDVVEFNTKFGVPHAERPSYLDSKTMLFRLNFMKEELQEFETAANADNMHEMADALVDLVYVALGTAHMMGLPWEKLWDEVQRSNMSKVRATSADQSKRGSTLDVIKPEDWQVPNHWAALDEGYGGGRAPFQYDLFTA
jgi:predicted HAD superfamily Cof-like phosphohydrolase